MPLEVQVQSVSCCTYVCIRIYISSVHTPLECLLLCTHVCTHVYTRIHLACKRLECLCVVYAYISRVSFTRLQCLLLCTHVRIRISISRVNVQSVYVSRVSYTFGVSNVVYTCMYMRIHLARKRLECLYISSVTCLPPPQQNAFWVYRPIPD